MRNPNRLNNFYDEIKELHKTYCPDWRFNQLILNYLSWYYNKYKHDGFYDEENKTLDKFKEFIKEIC